MKISRTTIEREYKLRTGASFKRGKSNQDYVTPTDFMQAVTAVFGPIAFDLAATAENSKAQENFYGPEDNSLVQEWHKLKGLLWLNPPFDSIGPWAKKCYEESLLGAEILFLVPASVGSNWFAKCVFEHASVRFLQGRLHFDVAHPTWGYPKDCMICHFTKTSSPGFTMWDWRKNIPS